MLHYDPAPAPAVDTGGPRTLDNWRWNRGRESRYRERPPHLTRTVFY